ncbi:hypothetical protein EV194_101437 [Natronoflexus pectinivorans]|uniref:Uncharacterized protein n=1 Tax=Natronoflexus pectinivorans TaxID=682526 RepID=A0A4R2GNE5_9BACT|nr:hypothetical protein EV194_101437 [Natronoflexus pectinivorans]
MPLNFKGVVVRNVDTSFFKAILLTSVSRLRNVKQ